MLVRLRSTVLSCLLLLTSAQVGCGDDDPGSEPSGDDEAPPTDDSDESPSSVADARTKPPSGDAASPARIDAGRPSAPSLDATMAPMSPASDAAVRADAANADMAPIPAPVADDCITDVKPGDHKFTCSNITFLTLVPPACTQRACGLIFDVHGGTMSGLQMRDNTQLHELAPSHGFIVVHPSATPMNTGGSWDLTNDPPKIADFFKRVIKAFHVDAKRIHFTGFSQGSAVTFYMMCHHSDLLASTAPLSGNSADVSCITRDWKPRIPFLFMSGITDSSLAIETSRTRWEGFIRELELRGGDVIDTDGHYTRKHWEDPNGLDFDYIEHDYGGQPVLAGHCVPGGIDRMGAPNNFGLNATTCTTGEIKLHWGKTALQWFLDHPKP